MNTGTPDAPTPEAIRPYLKEFLSDRNLIDLPSIVWKPILNLFILPNRPKETAARYEEFWTPEGSPFVIDSLAQCEAIERRVEDLTGEPAVVRLGMRYGNPSIEAGLRELVEAGADRVVALPMYPQDTRACTGTSNDEFRLQADRVLPASTPTFFVEEYWAEAGYIEALAASVRRSWNTVEQARTNVDPEAAPSSSLPSSSKLVVSFHSLPVSFAKKGDTYVEATRGTARLLGRALGLGPKDVMLTYHSPFGGGKWQGPMLVPELERVAREGVRDVAVVCPGFAADCLETIFDVSTEAAEAYKLAATTAGIDDAQSTYVPALGADEATMDVLARLVVKAATVGAAKTFG